MVVAIDGPACSGKSTLAKLVAKKIGYNFLNTGMIFRAISYMLNKNKIDDKSIEFNKFLNSLDLHVGYNGNEQYILINNKDVTKYLFTPKISSLASYFSQNALVREIVVNIQRKFANAYNLVVEGRDIGTEVFPNAKYKFFITANINIRAKRRYDDLKSSDDLITLESVKQELIKRDYEDTHRILSPLQQAKDSIVIDTSFESIDQSVNKIVKYIKE